MRKSCCLDDGNVTPKNSSCSMVLRSACSLGTCKKSTIVNKLRNQEVTPEKRKQHHTEEIQLKSKSRKNSQHFHSYLRSSLKHFAYKSAQTYSVLKESLYNRFEDSESQNANFLKENAFNKRDKEYDFSSCIGTFVNNNSISQEECCYITNNCLVTDYSEIMSRSRGYSRSRSSVNALSDSEEDFNQENLRKTRSKNSVSSSLGKTMFQVENNHSNHSSTASISPHNPSQNSCEISIQRGHHPSFFSTPHIPNNAYNRSENNHLTNSDSSLGSPTSEIDISTVQYSPIDRFRWFLWASVYLKIIKLVNFDVWILSRIHSHKKFASMLILIPLIFYLFYGALLHESQSNLVNDLSTSAIKFSSYLYSVLSSLFVNNERSSHISSEDSCFSSLSEVLHFFWLAILNFFSSFFVKIGEIIPISEKSTQTVIQTKAYKTEDLKLMVVEIWEERFKDMLAKLKESHSSNPAEKENLARKLQNDVEKLRSDFLVLTEYVQKLEKDVTSKSKSSLSKYESIIEDHKLHIGSINAKIKDYEEKLSSLSGSLRSFSDQKQTESDFVALFEKYFLIALNNIAEGDKKENSPYYKFSEWLRSNLSAERTTLSKDLKLEMEKLKSTSTQYDETFQRTVENVVHQYVDTLKRDSSTEAKTDILIEDAYSLEIVRKLIKDAIMLYDADKTGKVDYALESGGGSVLSTRCSESYSEKYGTISVLGFPLWSTHNSPRIAIQPDLQPGQCWAFKGSQGFLVIQLSYTIHPTGFTLEHIPLSLSPTGSIDSAPKDFSVWGLFSEKDFEGKLLGKYTYNQEGDPMQYFPVQKTYEKPFSYVELKIHSNHGNLEYTCLYRFRVHGKLPKN